LAYLIPDLGKNIGILLQGHWSRLLLVLFSLPLQAVSGDGGGGRQRAAAGGDGGGGSNGASEIRLYTTYRLYYKYFTVLQSTPVVDEEESFY